MYLIYYVILDDVEMRLKWSTLYVHNLNVHNRIRAYLSVHNSLMHRPLTSPQDNVETTEQQGRAIENNDNNHSITSLAGLCLCA